MHIMSACTCTHIPSADTYRFAVFLILIEFRSVSSKGFAAAVNHSWSIQLSLQENETIISHKKMEIVTRMFEPSVRKCIVT